MPIFGTREALCLLWEKASGNMRPHELRWLSDGALQQATEQARRLSETIDGVGCLVSADGDSEGRRAGNFQHHSDVPDLLLTIASHLDLIAGLTEIASAAEFRARDGTAVAAKTNRR